jgi:formate hydrogenlyase subunit 4
VIMVAVGALLLLAAITGAIDYVNLSGSQDLLTHVKMSELRAVTCLGLPTFAPSESCQRAT